MIACPRISTLAFALAVALVGSPGAGLAGHHEKTAEVHEPIAWDQARVTDQAGEFAAAAKKVRRTARRLGNPSVATMKARTHHAFMDSLRLIESESRHLASELASGEGLDATLSIYRRLRTLIRDAREQARKLPIPQDLNADIDAARTKLQMLAAYYPEV